jgi:4-amino-4-deoxy-L-arabinose transferase-like glycosyltransferase
MSTRRFVVAIAAAMLVGLAIRLAFHVAYAPARLPFADGLWYHFEANLLADGHGFIHPFDFPFRHQTHQSAGHPPLFVLVLAAVSWLGGTTVFAHQLTEIALDTGAVVMIGFLGREVAGARAGILAASLAAIYPGFWATEGEVLSESLYALIVASMLLLAFRFLRRPSRRGILALGVVVGLGALCRGEAVLFLPVLVVPAAVAAGSSRTRRMTSFAIAVAGVLVVVAPWTIYNATRFKKPVLISTSVGYLVAGANCERTYHGPELGLWDAACASRPVSGDESQRSEQLRHIGSTYARRHLGRLPIVVAARVGRLFEVYRPTPSTFGPSLVRGLMLASWYALIPLAIAGAAILRRRRTTLIPLTATVVAVAMTAALTWGTRRFRVPVDIAFVVLVAVAIDRAASLASSRRRAGA